MASTGCDKIDAALTAKGFDFNKLITLGDFDNSETAAIEESILVFNE
jgi:hypothetical protein